MTLQENSQIPYWQSLWGFLTTIALGFVIFIVFGTIQSTLVVVYGFYLEGWNMPADMQNMASTLVYNGDAIAVAETPSAIIGIMLVWLFASFRKPSSISNYLQLKLPTIPSLLKWLAVMVLVMVSMELINYWLERDIPEFMTKVYGSTTNYPLLWIAIIIAAPLFEELFFRGYLLEGIRNTPVGLIGAILITSSSWAIIHFQYGMFEIITIFLIGIILSIAKLKTKSLYIPIAMHMLMNLTATVMMEFY